MLKGYKLKISQLFIYGVATKFRRYLHPPPSGFSTAAKRKVVGFLNLARYKILATPLI